MIREEVSLKTNLGIEFESYTSKGLLVPDQLVIDLIMGQLTKVIDSGLGFLLDGFPRTIAQADVLQEKEIYLDLVVNLTQEEDVIIEKIINRRVCSKCGNNYNFAHIIFENYEMPPLVPEVEGICDGCGEENTLIQRDDDQEEICRERLGVYHKQTAPLIEYYENLGLVKEFIVNGGTKQLLPSFIELLNEN